MRTTVTLDDDLAVRLERRRTEYGGTFKDVVNEALRAGLTTLEAPDRPADGERVVTQPLPLGRRLVADVDDVADALAIGEGEDYA